MFIWGDEWVAAATCWLLVDESPLATRLCLSSLTIN